MADPGPDWSPGPVLWCGIPKIFENGKDEDMIAIAVTGMGGGENLGRLVRQAPRIPAKMAGVLQVETVLLRDRRPMVGRLISSLKIAAIFSGNL